MIRSFRCAETQALHNGFSSRKFQRIERAARKRLRWLHAATDLNDLIAIRGNRLEALKGDRIGQHGIRINDRWRICFSWRDGHAYDVELWTTINMGWNDASEKETIADSSGGIAAR